MMTAVYSLFMLILSLGIIYGGYFLYRWLNPTQNVVNADGTTSLTAIAKSAAWFILILLAVIIALGLIAYMSAKPLFLSAMINYKESCKIKGKKVEDLIKSVTSPLKKPLGDILP